MKNGFLVLLFTLLGVCASCADDWQRADIYFIDWNVATRNALTPDRVRQLTDHKRTFRDDAPAVARLLEIEKLKPSKGGSKDVRFVIDLIDDTMNLHTYYATYFELYDASGKFSRRIDERFRQRIARLAESSMAKQR